MLSWGGSPWVVSNLRTLVALPLLCSAFIESLLHCLIALWWVWIMLCCPIPYPFVSWSCVALLCPTPRILLLNYISCHCAFLCIILCYIQRTLEPLSMILCHNTVKYVISTLRVMMKYLHIAGNWLHELFQSCSELQYYSTQSVTSFFLCMYASWRIFPAVPRQCLH